MTTYNSTEETVAALVADFKRAVTAAEAGDSGCAARLDRLRRLTASLYNPALRPPPSRDPYEDSVVYYIENAGLIKIGTSYEVERRRNTIGGKVLATEPGSYGLERERHRQFAGSRVGRTEWFQPSPALRQHIAALLDSD